MKLDIQLFADGKVVIETEVDQSGLKKGLKNTENSVNKTGSTIKGIIAGLGITSLISTAMSTINASIDGAVKRVDTLNNFPKVMSNLGISSQDASKSINTLSDRLTGLPTTLNDAASAVQRLTSANGDINKSTDIFLAMNNAILAGGASMDIQTSAMEQLSQAYAKGKPDAMEWRSILTAMPAQLKQMASELGYTSTAVGGDFYEAIQKGNLSMDDFMNTMIKLNKKGTGSFASFEKQARSATGGIQTSVTNMKTSITRGVTNIIKQLDKSLEKYGGLSGVINNIGKTAEDVLGKVGDVLLKIVPPLIKIAETIIKILPFIAPLLAGLLTYTTIMKTVEIVTTAVSTAQAILNAVMAANPIALVIAGIVALIAAFVLLWKKCEWFRNFWIGLWNVIATTFTKTWNNIKSFITEKVPKIVDDLVGFFKDLPGKMLDIGKNMINGLWDGLKNTWDKVKSGVKDLCNKIVDGFKNVFQIHSPSRRFRDEIGKNMALGMGVGFEDEISSVYNGMQRAVNMEQAKLQANVETGKTFNNLMNTTPIQINLQGDVQMDSQKVGRLVTPAVSKTLKTGGVY